MFLGGLVCWVVKPIVAGLGALCFGLEGLYGATYV